MAAKPTYEELELKVEELERKAKKLTRTEEKLKRKITELNSFINNVPDMAWLKDRKSRFIAVNKTFGEAVGMTPGSLINKTCEVCFGKEAAKKFREDDQEVMKGKKQVTIVEKIKNSKKNEEVWLETIKSPIFNESGKVSGTVGIARDITRRKQTEKEVQDSEKRFRLIFENSSDGIIVADPETMKFIYVNPAICKILGYTEEELTQMGVVDIHPKESLEHVVSEFKAQARGKKLLAANIPFLKKNEKIIYMDTNSSIVRIGQEIRIMGVFRDVTERKLAEKALMESEKRYRAVVESQTEMICRFLPDGTLTFVNEAYCRYFGKSRKELIGQNFVFLILEDDRKKVLKNIVSLNQNNPVMTHEYQVVNSNGEICWHRWNNRAIFDDQNKLLEFQSVGLDITERVRAEKALMESKESYRRLVETMNDGLGIQDEKGTITYVNSKFGQMLGYKPENLIGKPVSDFLDDRNKQILKNQISIRKKGDVLPYEIEWISKGGKNISTMMSPQAIFDEKRQFKGSFSVITDISSLKQVEEELSKSEERYRSLAENSQIGFWQITMDGHTLYINPAMCSMLEIENPEELHGMTYDSFFDEKNQQIIKRELTKREKGISSSYEVELIGKKGTKRNVIISGATLFLSDNNIHSTIGTITDITDQKKAEKALMKAHDELEKRVEERTKELEIQKSSLEETNIAMQVLLEKREEDKKEMEDNVLTNVKEMIAPYVKKLKKIKLNDQQNAILNIVESNLNEIISPFSRKMSSKYLNLTPTEIHVANLIRHGINSKEIAELMGLSPQTIYNHRKNIRKKFGLENKRTNLRSHLLSIY
ncbi:MAG TPA: PAS domain S-box protein [Balneolales bacterium]|nr:PAS domain S-box protein [Balneolales bacterium]